MNDLNIPDFLNRKLWTKERKAESERLWREMRPAAPSVKVKAEAERLREIIDTEKQIEKLEAYVRRTEASPPPEGNPHLRFAQDRTLDIQEGVIRSLKAKLIKLKEAA